MDTEHEFWNPIIEEPVGLILRRIEDDDPEIALLVDSPRRILAFRTFAYIRVGVLLGQLLFENELPAYTDEDTWVDAILRDPRHREAVGAEIRAVAEEIARDPSYADETSIGPDDAVRERFRAFARSQIK